MKAARTALLLAVMLLVSGCAAGQAETPPAASAENPLMLTGEQAETLAGMRFRNHEAGVVGFEARLLGAGGDLRMTGWVDFTGRTGYASIVPAGGRPFLAAWDSEQVAFRDMVDGDGPPPETAPVDGWEKVEFRADSSELTRMLAALLLLSDDRPENPQLLRQNGARYLGDERIDGALVSRFSGVTRNPSGADEADLGTQYWLDDRGRLVRFGIRISGPDLSTVDFVGDQAVPSQLPVLSGIESSDAG